MVTSSDGIETKVWITPYEYSEIAHTYMRKSGKCLLVSSVEECGDRLVSLCLPSGGTVIVEVAQLITAVQKCVL